MYLSGDFAQRNDAFGALRDLRGNGVNAPEIAVFSDEPLDFPHGILDRPSRMSFIVVSGAITAFLLVVGFVYFTQHNYPIVTGGMPIFSFWATGVVFYELTMLGAILTTFVWFLRESGLLKRGKRPPVPDSETGMICVRVECSADRAESTKHSLASHGARNVRTLG